MEKIATKIPGAYIIEPKVYGDSRGYFFESYTEREIQRLLGDIRFIQDNESRSTRGVVRGLHFQKGENAQAKLVRVAYGKVLDVGVDLRKDSPTYGEHIAVELSDENHRMLFLPRGMAHGFAVLSEEAIFEYKCDNYYCPESEGAIAWDDPDLGIDWQLSAGEVKLSAKDSAHPRLKDLRE